MAGRKKPPTRGEGGRRPRLPDGFLGQLVGGLFEGLGDAAKVSSFVGSRVLATNGQCIDAVARYMVDDEYGDGEWSRLMAKDQKLWQMRAKAALLGLDRYLRDEMED